jgi:hypothetical protein
MAGKKKQGNKHREARFKSHPERAVANAKRRWQQQFNKTKAKALKRGDAFTPRFKTYEDEVASNKKRQ